jgi:hypothetical protein
MVKHYCPKSLVPGPQATGSTASWRNPGSWPFPDTVQFEVTRRILAGVCDPGVPTTTGLTAASYNAGPFAARAEKPACYPKTAVFEPCPFPGGSAARCNRPIPIVAASLGATGLRSIVGYVHTVRGARKWRSPSATQCLSAHHSLRAEQTWNVPVTRCVAAVNREDASR